MFIQRSRFTKGLPFLSTLHNPSCTTTKTTTKALTHFSSLRVAFPFRFFLLVLQLQQQGVIFTTTVGTCRILTNGLSPRKKRPFFFKYNNSKLVGRLFFLLSKIVFYQLSQVRESDQISFKLFFPVLKFCTSSFLALSLIIAGDFSPLHPPFFNTCKGGRPPMPTTRNRAKRQGDFTVVVGGKKTN